MISDGSIFYHTAVTVAETGISFALIVLLGVGTAILLWSSKTISCRIRTVSCAAEQPSKICPCAYDYRVARQ